MLFGTVAPAALPAFASAESQITNRSIAMSDSDGGVAGVNYTVTFTPNETGANHSVAIEFCSTSPLLNSTCSAMSSPFTLSSATAAVNGAGAASPTFQNDNAVIVTSVTLTSGANSIVLAGVTNPPASTQFYAKVLIYNDASGDTNALAGLGGPTAGATHSASTAINESDPNLVDAGSVALETINDMGVQAAVLESLQFCVMGNTNNVGTGSTNAANDTGTALTDATTNSTADTTDAHAADAPKKGCVANTNTNPDPEVNLGQWNSGVQALSTSAVSYGVDWAQLNTNASAGAVVYLRSNLNCAGLSRNAGTDSCNGISSYYGGDGSTEAGGTGGLSSLTVGNSGFGFSFGAGQSTYTGTTADGKVGDVTINGNYAGGKYALLKHTAAITSTYTGVPSGLPQDTTNQSTYGGFVFDSTGAPIANVDIPMGLAAAASNSTPAGLYKATFTLNAVGTF